MNFSGDGGGGGNVTNRNKRLVDSEAQQNMAGQHVSMHSITDY